MVRRNSREYRIWQGMKRRCLDPRRPDFKNYGGRGIQICARWMDFAHFYEDMGPSPAGHWIERVDNGGHYEPGNCRWATPRDQLRNTRFNVYVELEGRKLCISELSETTGLPYHCLYRRLIRNGWTLGEALAPSRGTRRGRGFRTKARPRKAAA